MYSSLDPSARKINTAKFVNKKVSVLTVTDVAARGIDIPSLDYVVNLHFPGKPKLFVHRVGRCARAGRTGIAYSIFSTDDAAHVLDLHLFLNRQFNINDNKTLGIAPQELMEEEHLSVTEVKNSQDIVSDFHFNNKINCNNYLLFVKAGVLRTSENAYKKYLSSRPVASAESNARIKKIKFYSCKHLDDFLAANLSLRQTESANCENNSKSKEDLMAEDRKLQEEKHDLLLKMRNFKPSTVSNHK